MSDQPTNVVPMQAQPAASIPVPAPTGPFRPASTYERMDAFRCTLCDLGTGPGQEDIEDEDEDDEVPLAPNGWARITIDMVIPNVDFASQVAQREETIRQAMAGVIQQAGKELGQIPAHEMMMIREQAETVIPPVDGKPFLVHSATVALCSGCLQRGLSSLGVESE